MLQDCLHLERENRAAEKLDQEHTQSQLKCAWEDKLKALQKKCGALEARVEEMLQAQDNNYATQHEAKLKALEDANAFLQKKLTLYHTNLSKHIARGVQTVRQILYYLSDRNMACDTYLRQRMDPTNGYISLDLLANFPRLRMENANAYMLSHLLKGVEQTELSPCGTRVRMSNGRWQHFVPSPSVQPIRT